MRDKLHTEKTDDKQLKMFYKHKRKVTMFEDNIYLINI